MPKREEELKIEEYLPRFIACKIEDDKLKCTATAEPVCKPIIAHPLALEAYLPKHIPREFRRKGVTLLPEPIYVCEYNPIEKKGISRELKVDFIRVKNTPISKPIRIYEKEKPVYDVSKAVEEVRELMRKGLYGKVFKTPILTSLRAIWEEAQGRREPEEYFLRKVMNIFTMVSPQEAVSVRTVEIEDYGEKGVFLIPTYGTVKEVGEKAKYRASFCRVKLVRRRINGEEKQGIIVTCDENFLTGLRESIITYEEYLRAVYFRRLIEKIIEMGVYRSVEERMNIEAQARMMIAEGRYYEALEYAGREVARIKMKDFLSIVREAVDSVRKEAKELGIEIGRIPEVGDEIYPLLLKLKFGNLVRWAISKVTATADKETIEARKKLKEYASKLDEVRELMKKSIELTRKGETKEAKEVSEKAREELRKIIEEIKKGKLRGNIEKTVKGFVKFLGEVTGTWNPEYEEEEPEKIIDKLRDEALKVLEKLAITYKIAEDEAKILSIVEKKHVRTEDVLPRAYKILEIEPEKYMEYKEKVFEDDIEKMKEFLRKYNGIFVKAVSILEDADKIKNFYRTVKVEANILEKICEGIEKAKREEILSYIRKTVGISAISVDEVIRTLVHRIVDEINEVVRTTISEEPIAYTRPELAVKIIYEVGEDAAKEVLDALSEAVKSGYLGARTAEFYRNLVVRRMQLAIERAYNGYAGKLGAKQIIEEGKKLVDKIAEYYRNLSPILTGKVYSEVKDEIDEKAREIADEIWETIMKAEIPPEFSYTGRKLIIPRWDKEKGRYVFKEVKIKPRGIPQIKMKRDIENYVKKNLFIEAPDGTVIVSRRGMRRLAMLVKRLIGTWAVYKMLNAYDKELTYLIRRDPQRKDITVLTRLLSLIVSSVFRSREEKLEPMISSEIKRRFNELSKKYPEFKELWNYVKSKIVATGDITYAFILNAIARKWSELYEYIKSGIISLDTLKHEIEVMEIPEIITIKTGIDSLKDKIKDEIVGRILDATGRMNYSEAIRLINENKEAAEMEEELVLAEMTKPEECVILREDYARDIYGAVRTDELARKLGITEAEVFERAKRKGIEIIKTISGYNVIRKEDAEKLLG